MQRGYIDPDVINCELKALKSTRDDVARGMIVLKSITYSMYSPYNTDSWVQCLESIRRPPVISLGYSTNSLVFIDTTNPNFNPICSTVHIVVYKHLSFFYVGSFCKATVL